MRFGTRSLYCYPLHGRGVTCAPICALVTGLAIVLAGAGLARAHQASITHSRVEVSHDQRSVVYQLKFEPADLSEALGLGVDIEPSDAQVAAGESRLLDYVLARVQVKDGESACPIERRGARPVMQGSRFIQVEFVARCARSITELVIEYQLFFDIDALHRGLMQVSYRGESAITELREGASRFVWDLAEPPPENRLAFVISGVEHIAFGFDHLAFLFGLLLVVPVARRRDGPDDSGEASDPRDVEIRALGPGLRYTAAIVTSFTIAHSVTLIGASLGWFALSSRLVESLIAASIVFVAIENIARPDPRYRYALTFGFGLIHGLGFASVLGVLLPPADVIWPLLMFNVGVEAGQLLIVLLMLPLLHLAARGLGATRYRDWPLTLGSGILALLGAAWLIERVFDTVILGF